MSESTEAICARLRDNRDRINHLLAEVAKDTDALRERGLHAGASVRYGFDSVRGHCGRDESIGVSKGIEVQVWAEETSTVKHL